jgi:tRNA wybutosine-synthesizing protein 1
LQFTINGEPRPDEPKEIIDGCIEARRQLLTGFGGREGIDKRKLKEAMTPTSAAISLAGEPTLYPRIAELIEEFDKRKMQSFLVTNGTRPDRLQGLTKEPTNLYISLCAPDKKTYLKVNRPLIVDGWEKVNESLELMKSFSCRKVIRLTLVNGLNFFKAEKYAKLISKTYANFVEVKSYSWVGESRQRLPGSSVISMEALKEFAQKIAEATSYKIKDTDAASRVVLLEK